MVITRNQSKQGDSSRPVTKKVQRAEEVTILIPGCSMALPGSYSSAVTFPLDKSNTDIFPPDATYESITSRLLRLREETPGISLFPFPMIDVVGPKKKLKWHRSSRLKGKGDDRFSFTTSALMKFPKGSESVRLGIFVGTQLRDDIGHTWAVAVVDVEGGKMVVFYDPDSSVTFSARGYNLYWDDLHAPQRAFLKKFKSTKNVKHGKWKVKYVMFGGNPELDNVNKDRCLENTLRWMESCRDISVLSESNLINNNFVFVESNPSPNQRMLLAQDEEADTEDGDGKDDGVEEEDRAGEEDTGGDEEDKSDFDCEIEGEDSEDKDYSPDTDCSDDERM